jgi:hypothetical protein
VPDKITLLRIFVASPGDVSEERQLLDREVDTLNRTLGVTQGARFELEKWETHTWPGFGLDAQAVINEQIEPYDIFVGIMWARIGTPTLRAASGTIEEFDNAYALWATHKRPTILLYFRNTPFQPKGKEQRQQHEAVSEFRKAVKAKGGLFRSYDAPTEFARLAYEHLYRQAQLILAEFSPAPRDLETKTLGPERAAASPVEPAHEPAPPSQPIVKQQAQLLDALLSPDPVVGIPAMEALIGAGPSVVPAIVERLRAMPKSAVFCVRTLLARFPEESSPLLVERIRSQDWAGMTQVPDCCSPVHLPYAGEHLNDLLQNGEIDPVRKTIEAIGFMAGVGWCWRLIELIRDGSEDEYEKLNYYVTLAVGRTLVQTPRGPGYSMNPLADASYYLKTLVSEMAERGWRGTTYSSLAAVMTGCRAQHADVLLSDWISNQPWELRDLASVALGSMRLNRALPHLTAEAESEAEVEEVRASAIAAIGHIGGRKGLEVLERLEVSTPRLVDARKRALAYCLTDADDTQFTRLASSLWPETFGHLVYRAIGRRQQTQFLGLLDDGLVGGDAAGRGDCALAIARLFGPSARDRLLRAHADASSSRERVLTALALLKVELRPPDDPELMELRGHLANEAYLYQQPTRVDILEVLKETQIPEAKSIWSAWSTLLPSLTSMP